MIKWTIIAKIMIGYRTPQKSVYHIGRAYPSYKDQEEYEAENEDIEFFHDYNLSKKINIFIDCSNAFLSSL